MGLVLKETSSTFTPVPAGQYTAVCVDVVDLGVIETTWQGKKKQAHKCRVVFELDEMNEANGKRFTISRMFTASLGEKATLRAFLESWRGKAFTADELAGFDTEQLIGVGAVVQVVHTQKESRTYDNINSIMKPMKGMAKLEPSGQYVRVKDRTEAQTAAQGGDEPPPLTDDDLPF